MSQSYYKQRRSSGTNTEKELPFEINGITIDNELGDINEALEGLVDTSDHKETPEPPITPPGEDPDGNLPLTPENGEPVVATPVSPMDKAKAFLKEWWWAVAIAAYVAYKLWKGDKQ